MAGLCVPGFLLALFSFDADPPLSEQRQGDDRYARTTGQDFGSSFLRSIDWVGALLVSTGLILLTFSLALTLPSLSVLKGILHPASCSDRHSRVALGATTPRKIKRHP